MKNIVHLRAVKAALRASALLLIATSVHAQDCDRACLRGTIDRYIDALV